MRKCLIALCGLLLLCKVQGQTVQANLVTPLPGDQFPFDGQVMSNYGIRWGADSWDANAWSTWVSGFGGIKFFTQAKPRLVVNGSGNVGIGTSSPASKLHVSNENVQTIQIIEGSDPYIYSGLRFIDNGQSTARRVKEWSIWAGRDGGTWGSGLGFMRYDAVNPCAGGICDLSLFLHDNGNVGVGTINPSEKLSVNGNIRAKKVIVSQTGWADYVFDSSYTLKPIEDVATYIQENKHLPDMPTATEVAINGLDLGEIIKQQQAKIEELTLYLIKMNKEKKALQDELLQQLNRSVRQNELLQKRIENLEHKTASLK
jgi:hypothetical protein